VCEGNQGRIPARLGRDGHRDARAPQNRPIRIFITIGPSHVLRKLSVLGPVCESAFEAPC
jgi:hypothetical protein